MKDENFNPEAEENTTASKDIETDGENFEPQEINTYDLVPISKKISSGNGIWKKLYSFTAVVTVLLAVIFSSAEIFDFIINDFGTGNLIIKRIFGGAPSENGLSLGDLIINNSFLIPGTDKSESSPEAPSEESPPMSSPPSTESTPSAPPQGSSSDTLPDGSSPPENESGEKIPIISMDMSLLSYGKNYIYNDTALTPDVSALLSAPLTKYSSGDHPLVLVIHTHGTESYMPDGASFYTNEGELARSSDPRENMIAIGKEFVRILEERGIPTVHCEIMHDKESYRDSYNRAAKSIEGYLKQYPSIKYVFDLHRDSIMRSTGELVSAVASVNGENCSQIMPVVGSGYNDWEENLSFALKLRDEMNSKHVNLCRPVCLRESTYNQNLSEISVLLEIGSSGNSLTEALRAARLTAEAVARLILEA